MGSGVRALSLREQPIAQGATVRPLEPGDAPAMHPLLTANRAHLDRWLRWSSAVRTPADVAALIARFQAQLAGGDGFHCAILADGVLAGGVVCWNINRQNRNAEVGYWLGTSHTGRGLATAAARWAVARLFEVEGVHRVEMQCGVPNDPAARSPRGWVFERKGSAGSLTGSPTDSSITSCTGCSTASGDSGATSLPGNGHE